MMTPTTRDKNSAWDLHTVCSTFKQSLFSVLPWCRKVDELNSRQNKPMWSSVWLRLSLSFRGNFLVVCHLQHDSILKKIFSQKSFSKNGMTLRKPKKKLRKESWQRTNCTTKWRKLVQVGVRGTSGPWRRMSPDLRGTRWNNWNKDKGSVQLNLSTCSKVGLQGRAQVPFWLSHKNYREYHRYINTVFWHLTKTIFITLSKTPVIFDFKSAAKAVFSIWLILLLKILDAQNGYQFGPVQNKMNE